MSTTTLGRQAGQPAGRLARSEPALRLCSRFRALGGLLVLAALLVSGCTGGRETRTTASGSGRLTVHIELQGPVELQGPGGLQGPAGGSIAVALFASKAAFDSETDPVASERLVATPGTTRWTFASLPFGDYAVKAYHDLNDNGRLDRNPLGIPTEPYGFSNNARGRFGPPRYSEARFTHAAPRTELSIVLQ